ncbi:MAG: cytochrome P460 family protein [Verrucomicrobiota bacterium]
MNRTLPQDGIVLFALALLALPMVAGDGASAPADRPAPATDRVGFPAEYATRFAVLRTFDRGERQVVTVYGNVEAAQVKGAADLPFPNGSILVMETADAVRDASGARRKGPDGRVEKEKVVGLHVMRRGPDFGTAYGTNRAGPWEFVEYRPDGSYLTPPAKSAACAECHVKAGPARDYVYRGPLPPAAP